MAGIPDITPLDEIVGAVARQKRLAVGMSQEKMAEILDCSVGMVSQLENGKRAWSNKWIYVLCKYFNIEPAELFGGVVLSPQDKQALELVRAVREADKKIETLSSPKPRKPKK